MPLLDADSPSVRVVSDNVVGFEHGFKFIPFSNLIQEAARSPRRQIKLTVNLPEMEELPIVYQIFAACMERGI